MAIGDIIGSVVGGAVGTAIAPGIGTTIGSKLGGKLGGAIGGGGGEANQTQQGGGGGGGLQQAGAGALGIAQLIGSGVRRKQAEAAAPSLEDPEARGMLARIRRQRKRAENLGLFAGKVREAREGLGVTQRNVLRASGGAGGAAIAGISQAQKGFGTTILRLGEAGARLSAQLAETEAGVQRGISQRRLELQLLNRSQLLAQAAQGQQAGQQNLGAATAFAGRIGGGGGQAGAFPNVATPSIGGGNLQGSLLNTAGITPF